ncbi:MAG TPA: carboxypeptidase-like regulatory domain-containing protein [Rudaea sp.]|nr:carboxypeptidase-like regulatory domain-containing protein [Rudaea sp.]
MFRNRMFAGAIAFASTVMCVSAPTPSLAQTAAPEDAPLYLKGWEPKDGSALAQNSNEMESIPDSVRATDKSLKAQPVVGAMTRANAIGTMNLRYLPSGKAFLIKRYIERPENEGPPPHPTLLPGTEGTSSAEPDTGNGQATMSAPLAPAPAPIANFAGLDYNTWGAGHPPDTNGDVGPNYYIQTVNTSIGIYDKATGANVAAFTFDSFMSQGNFGNLCDTDNYGDPVVVYDSFEDRWIISDFAFTASGGVITSPAVYECFAVSRTGDPVSGGWYFYSDIATDNFPDYPKFGIWNDGLYRSANQFGPGVAGSGFVGTRVWAYNKAQMYAGAATVQIVHFDTPDAGDFTLLPSNARLQTGTPPAGTPNYFVSLWEYLNAQNVYAFHVDWARPSLSTFALVGTPAASSSWTNATTLNNITTPGGYGLDPLYIRAMMQNQYTNIGGVESLWNVHNVPMATTSPPYAPRYYQINVSGGTIAASDVQSANHAPDNTSSRWAASVAVDRKGDMAVGYSLADSATNPKIMYAGRLAGDAINTITQTEQTLIAGGGTQATSSYNRWGDYSAMTLDPDGCTFWYTNEYYATNSVNWQTRVGSFTYPSCTPVGGGGTLSGTVTDTTTSNPIIGATVMLGNRSATTNASGNYSLFVPAGSYPTENATAAGYNTVSVNAVAVSDGGTTTQNFALTGAPANACYTDTTQSDFQTADLVNIDLGSSAGNAELTSSSSATTALQETVISSGFSFTNTSWTGQVFTPTVTGTLTGADFDLFCSGCSGANPNITVSLRATSGSSAATAVPTGADLDVATIPGFNDNASGGYHSVTFTGGQTLTAGTRYALVLRVASARTGLQAYVISNSTGSNPYAGGSNVTSTNSGGTWTTKTRSMGFHVTVATPVTYATPGSLTSNAKDANPASAYNPTWTTLSWTGTAPANTTLRLQAAGSNAATGPFNFVGPDGTSATYFNSGDSLSQFNGSRYVKYQASLATSNTSATPVLSDVTLCSVNQGPPTKLAFTTQPPSSSVSGSVFAATVSVQDASGNVVTTDNSNVTIALAGGTLGANLAGTLTVQAVNGVATFSGLSVDKAGTGYTLHATDAGLTPADSSAFNIVAGAAAAISFTTQPATNANVTAGSPITLVAHVVDGAGNAVAGESVALAIASGFAGSTLTATSPQATNASGDAMFNNVSLNKVGTGTLSVTDGALIATSNSFNIVAASPDHLAFTPAPPSSIAQGQTLGSVTVTEYDAFDNQVTADSTTQVSLVAGSCSGTALGTQALAGGVVTFATTQTFMTVASGVNLSAAAGANPPTVAASTFDVIANGDFVFSDGFDGCRP